MSGHRPVARLLRLAAAVAALASYALWVRPQMLTWGATPDETTRTYLGDELVSDPDGGATIAKFLPAPPERSSPERPGVLSHLPGDTGGHFRPCAASLAEPTTRCRRRP